METAATPASTVHPGLDGLVRCPRCAGDVTAEAGGLRCAGCAALHPVREGVVSLLPEGMLEEENTQFYNAEDEARYGRDAGGMPADSRTWVTDFLADIDAADVVVEVGSGGGAFDGCHPGYVATDLSRWALERFSSGARVQASAEALPFRDGSVDAVFSVSTLEHVPHPARALGEIHRILAPGGRALLRPAWYVRPWTARAIHVRPFAELPIRDRLEKLTLPLRNGRPYQGAKVMPGRIARELAVRRGRELPFRYWKLGPNLDEFIVSDSDAYSSMDPQAVSAYFLSRGYRDLRRPTPASRLRYGYEPVVVEKPA